MTLLLGLGIALIWRYRRRPVLTGVLIAVLVSVKPFLWPLALWLLATRRYAALGYALVYGLVLNLIAWTVLGFNELHRYSRLLHALTSAEERRGYSMISFALHEGGGRTGAYALSLVLGALGALLCLAFGRRGREVTALALALSVSLLATPIVQLHYFALLLVPFALAHPRLGRAWALPLSMWLCPSPDRSWQIALALGIATAMVLSVLRRDSIVQDGTLALARSGRDLRRNGHQATPPQPPAPSDHGQEDDLRSAQARLGRWRGPVSPLNTRPSSSAT